MKLSKLAFRNIRRNSRRSLLSGGAIAIAAMAIVFMYSLAGGMMEDLSNNVFNYITGHIRIRHIDYDANEELNPLHLRIEDYEKIVTELEKQEKVQEVVPRIQFFTAIYRNDKTYNGFGMGVDFNREKSVMKLEDGLKKGKLPEMGRREILLSFGLAEDLGLNAGDKITLFTKNMYMGMSGMTFKVSGIVSFPVQGYNSSFFLLPIDTTQSFLKMGNSATEILVLLKDRKELDEFAAQTESNFKSDGKTDLSVKPWKAIGTWYSYIDMVDKIYAIMALFFFILGTTVIINTTMMVIFERMKEIGTIAAMGMTPVEIVRLFFLEAFFIGAISSLLGVLLGVGITLPLARVGLDLSAAMEGVSFEVSPVIYPVLSLKSTVLVFFYSAAVATLASIIPSRRAARITPVEALRSI